MSTATPNPETRQSVRPNPSEAFEQLVHFNHAICSNCFRRIKQDHRRVQAGIGAHDAEDHDEFGTETVRDDDGKVIGTTVSGTHGAVQSHPLRTTCEDCGSIGGRAEDATLSRREMLDRVGPLAARLREEGLAVDEFVIRYTVRKLKSRDALQGYDREIFERAVKLGVKHA